MKKESEIRNRIKLFIKSTGTTEDKFESKAGLSTGFVSNIGDSIRKASKDKILKAYPSLGWDWVLTGNGSPGFEVVETTTDVDEGLPLIPFEYMAGFGEDNEGIMLNECERYKIPEFKNIGAEFLVRVGGNSMYPKYSSGDILACRKIPRAEITFFQWGKIYVIDSSQGQMIKRICEHDDEERIWLVSDNKEKLTNDKEKYAPFAILKNEIRSLSIVVGAVRME